MSRKKVSSNYRNEIAAVDLGSNSFHMIIGSDDDQGCRIREQALTFWQLARAAA